MQVIKLSIRTRTRTRPCTSEFAMCHTGFTLLGEDYFCDYWCCGRFIWPYTCGNCHLYTEHPLWDGDGMDQGVVMALIYAVHVSSVTHHGFANNYIDGSHLP